MSMPLEQGSSRTILDDAVILRLKHYIERKHPEFTPAQRAAVFANAVHRMVDRHLPDFEHPVKDRLRKNLIRRMGLEQRFTLLTGDVLEACLELELEEPGLRQLSQWMETYQPAVPLAGIPGGEWEHRKAVPVPSLPETVRSWKERTLRILAVMLLILLPAGGEWSLPNKGTDPVVISGTEWRISAALPAPGSSSQAEGVLPTEYAYRPINEGKLRTWLQAKDSLLADEPYLSAILTAAKEHGIHPLLLVAITGQEQNYVPRSGKNAKRIANNPFNVHNSWQTYNTDIADSARIASQTILSISRTRPDEAHPIQWINTRYAEDPNWWVGVTSIFEKLKGEAGE